MTPEARLAAVQGMELHFREALDTVTAKLTSDEAERLTLAAAVLSLMLRRLYHKLGDQWLADIVKAVMAP
jgi:Flp pilus assembly protein CpaB